MKEWKRRFDITKRDFIVCYTYGMPLMPKNQTEQSLFFAGQAMFANVISL
jgi:hypothetical protein